MFTDDIGDGCKRRAPCGRNCAGIAAGVSRADRCVAAGEWHRPKGGVPPSAAEGGAGSKSHAKLSASQKAVKGAEGANDLEMNVAKGSAAHVRHHERHLTLRTINRIEERG